MDDLLYTRLVVEIYNQDSTTKLRKIKSELESLIDSINSKLTKLESQPSPNQLPLL